MWRAEASIEMESIVGIETVLVSGNGNKIAFKLMAYHRQ